MDKEQVKALLSMCQRLSDNSLALLEDCTIRANSEIYEYLMKSLTSGLSYDRMLKQGIVVPLNRKDFYAYRRYALALFRDYSLQGKSSI